MEKSQHTPKYRKLLLELKLARIRADLTQTDVATRLKVYKTYISKVEAGERKIDVVELAHLCKLYGTTVAQLLKAAGIE